MTRFNNVNKRRRWRKAQRLLLGAVMAFAFLLVGGGVFALMGDNRRVAAATITANTKAHYSSGYQLIGSSSANVHVSYDFSIVDNVATFNNVVFNSEGIALGSRISWVNYYLYDLSFGGNLSNGDSMPSEYSSCIELEEGVSKTIESNGWWRPLEYNTKYKAILVAMYETEESSSSGYILWDSSVDEMEYLPAPVSLPADPVKTGYTFDYWCFDSALTQPYDGRPIYETTSLYAKFTPINYTITYTQNGGTGANNGNYNIETATITLPTPTRTGYTFGGWFDNSGLSGTAITKINKGSTGNKTFYAKWTIVSYSITYNVNGGNTVANGNYNIETATITLPTPTRTGYTFGGWFDNSGLSGTAITQIAKGSTGNKTFYAKWTINKYVVSYEYNNGVVGTSITVDYDTVLAAPNAITRTGYTFIGWYTDSNYLTSANFNNAIVGDITYYAKWVINVYTVTFYVDGEPFYSMQVEHGQSLQQAAARVLEMISPLYTDITMSSYFAESTTITDNQTLYSAEINPEAMPYIELGLWVHDNIILVIMLGGGIVFGLLYLVFLLGRRFSK